MPRWGYVCDPPAKLGNTGELSLRPEKEKLKTKRKRREVKRHRSSLPTTPQLAQDALSGTNAAPCREPFRRRV